MNHDFIVVGTFSDDPLASDVAHYLGQDIEISELIAIKNFSNSEFCPRFLCDEKDMENIGQSLRDKTVIIVSSCSGELTRNARAMRTFLVARAAKDNGASRVVLVEPDLFYSAQDRGPNATPGEAARTVQDYKKFDGQPFSANLYADLLHASGVDVVLTVHNHSEAVQELFKRRFDGQFFNLTPSGLYARYLIDHEAYMTFDGRGLVLCAPDRGAVPFTEEVFQYMSEASGSLFGTPKPSLLIMDKVRSGERKVEIKAHQDSPTRLEDIADREVVVIDDMVRTGNTIVECCKRLKEARARRVVFVVTHFNSSPEVKENLDNPAIDDIITTNTIPSILNRDMQGRLRRKMLILKLERWIANVLRRDVLHSNEPQYARPYTVDISRKNPRWRSTLDLQD
ncbi:MAG: ribose-phosphate pyrophosphokinase [Lentisphaerae bacterium]|jgi:ribose-phosphate pyrophosphokinase|nr:ribose-phosphate pyrophosphokinase [Lentisphaerota bacterium]